MDSSAKYILGCFVEASKIEKKAYDASSTFLAFPAALGLAPYEALAKLILKFQDTDKNIVATLNTIIGSVSRTKSENSDQWNSVANKVIKKLSQALSEIKVGAIDLETINESGINDVIQKLFVSKNSADKVKEAFQIFKDNENLYKSEAQTYFSKAVDVVTKSGEPYKEVLYFISKAESQLPQHVKNIDVLLDQAKIAKQELQRKQQEQKAAKDQADQFVGETKSPSTSKQ